jgi:hypothetical protein
LICDVTNNLTIKKEIIMLSIFLIVLHLPAQINRLIFSDLFMHSTLEYVSHI